MAKGGNRPGAGRPQGATNRLSMRQREDAAKTGLLPHEFLLAVARGENVDGHKPTFAERLDAAKTAAPYFAARLSSVRVEPQKQSAFDLSDLPANPRDCTTGGLLRAMLAGLAADSPAWDRVARDEGVRGAILRAFDPVAATD